ncbi:MAG: amidohydrolase family protein [Candidatus Rokuibacteriota bacterium]
MRLYLKGARLIDGTGRPVEELRLVSPWRVRQGHPGVRRRHRVHAPRGHPGRYQRGAELMRMQDRIGTLERGKLADLVIVNGDPLRDISVLQDRQRLSVMKGGRFVTQQLA